MPETSFTFRVDDTLKQAFTHAAREHNRTEAQILRDLMRAFVQQKTTPQGDWFEHQVQLAIESANAGRLIPANEVETAFAARRAATRCRLQASS